MNSKSIIIKLIVYTILILLFSLSIASFYSVSSLNSKTKSSFESNLSSKMIAASVLLDSSIKSVGEQAAASAKSNALLLSVQLSIASQIEGYLENLKDNNPDIDEIILLNNDTVLYSTLRNPHEHIGNFINKVIKGDFVFSGIIFNGLSYIAGSAPLYDSTGIKLGTIIILRKFDSQSKLIKEIETLLKTRLYIFFRMKTDNSKFIYQNDDQVIIPKQGKHEFVRESVMIGRNNFFLFCKLYKDIDGNENIILSVGENKGELVKSILTVFTSFTLIFLICAGIAISLIIIILNYFLSPMNEIIDSMNEMSRGTLSSRCTVKSNDEMGILGRNFNALADKMEIMIHEQEITNKKLVEFNNLKDEFLANTSHELRTPLHGITGIIDSILDNSLGDISDQVRSNLTMVYISAKRLTNLVNDILDFSKLKKSDITLQIKNSDIKTLTDIIITLLDPIAQSKHIKLINNISPEISPVLCDENRTQQILYNLIGNAVKFTDTGSVEISAVEDNNNEVVRITIKDTGIGIALDKIDRIFESFEQADGSISRKYGGTGLGLSITRKLVELHGGTIEVVSEPYKGSAFIFTLPAGSKTAKREYIPLRRNLSADDLSDNLLINKELKPLTNAASAECDRKFLILAVDDEPINLQVIVNQLTPRGYEVITASEGLTALNVIEEKGSLLDLIILDLMMPKISGYDVCRKVREKFSEIEIPVLMLTAKNLPEDLEMGFISGANDYIAKPFEKIELIARIDTLVRLKYAVNESLIKAREYAKEKQEHELSKELRIIHRDLTSVLQVEKVIEMLLREISRWISCSKARVLIKNNTRFDIFNYEKSIDRVTFYKSEDLKNVKNDVLDKIIASDNYIILNNSDKDLFNNPVDRISLLGIPLVYSGDIVGLVVFESNEEFIVNKIRMNVILTIVEQGVIAIENAELFEKVKTANKMLEHSLKELKEAQHQLIISEKKAVLGSLVSGVAHEINTPIGIAVTGASLISDESKKMQKLFNENQLLKSDMNEYLKLCQESSELILSNMRKAADLVSSFKQVSVDQSVEEKRLFNVRSYIDELLVSLKSKFRGTSHRVTVNCDPQLQIESYPGAFSQILTNFILNSLLHGFEGVENGIITIDFYQSENEYILKYTDNGVGIPADIIGKIYDPFFTTKRNSGGTGLGLNIVYNLVTQRLMGKITCTSSPGKGVEFKVTL